MNAAFASFIWLIRAFAATDLKTQNLNDSVIL